MAQHDYVIANGTGAAVRSDLNNALAAIVSQNSGATAPATTYAYQFWADTTTNLLKLRNSANSARITLFQLDGEWSLIPFENGTAAAPSIYFKDSGTDTGFYSPGTDQVGIATGGTARMTIDSNGNLAVDTNSLYVDATNNRVGIGTSSPSSLLHLSSNLPVLTFTDVNDASSSIVYQDDNLFVIDVDSANAKASSALAFKVDNTERARIDSSGRVGIGTTPETTLDVNGAITLRPVSIPGTGKARIYERDTDSKLYIQTGTGNAIRFLNSSQTDLLNIDSSGRLLVGTSSSSDTNCLVAFQGNPASASNGAQVHLRRGEAASAITSGEGIGYLVFTDNTDKQFAYIGCEADATAGTNDYPGRLVFSTTADGASSPTERMRIGSNGYIYLNTTNASPAENNVAGVTFQGGGDAGTVGFNRDGFAALLVGRKTNDGDLVRFYQDGTQEGSISVSGTTVTLNGAHLSRWSQIPGIDPHDKAVRPEILRGTVMSNLDEMCDWIDPDSGDAQANEQLNKTKISDVEGDKNVAGVFQSWDDDDDTWVNDYYLAMTGDFVIRIAAGVTVERGDLLMSAGDGTAKPQTDDALRSCTIAKVTSTHVSHTFDDGSYCVPCVLMAC